MPLLFGRTKSHQVGLSRIRKDRVQLRHVSRAGGSRVNGIEISALEAGNRSRRMGRGFCTKECLALQSAIRIFSINNEPGTEDDGSDQL
ncbi:MAG: hypothetical protein AAGU11_18410 [Syntrophobacteraceae bacterium]